MEKMNLLIGIGENYLEFYSYEESNGAINFSKQKYKTKLNIFGIQNGEEYNEDILQMEHSEKQEILRSISNKITREDIDSLNRLKVFRKEQILKV